MSDIEKNQFSESMITGGISMISKGYADTNNKFLKSYDPNKRTLFIIYLDANNLYGQPMIQLIPNEILNWVNLEKFNPANYSHDGSVGCFLQVDLDHPNEVYDYPRPAEKTKVSKKCCLNISYNS